MSANLKKRFITSLFLFLLLTLMYYYSFIMIISLIIISLITWVEFYAIVSKIYSKDNLKEHVLRIIFKAISLFYLSMIVSLIILNHNTETFILIIYSMFVSIASDIGGIVIGKIFKGKKLTKISPNKTISGSIGSFIFSLLLIPFFINYLNIASLVQLSFITIVISLASQLGDLFISSLKRKAKIKNTSDILPGHGGFLDRIDGMIFAIPIGTVLFKFL